MKKKKRKETAQSSHQGRREILSTGSKRKWEVEPSVDEVGMQAGDNPTENKQNVGRQVGIINVACSSFGCCSRTKYGRPQVACRQKSSVVGQAESLPCPGFLPSRCRQCQMIPPQE